MSGTFEDMKPQPATPDLPASHSLQVDGQLSDNVDGGRTRPYEVPGVGEGRPDKLDGRTSINEQNDRSCVLVFDRGRDLPVRVCGKGSG